MGVGFEILAFLSFCPKKRIFLKVYIGGTARTSITAADSNLYFKQKGLHCERG